MTAALRAVAAPPHDLEAEEAVLGACLAAGTRANHILNPLSIEDFYAPKHQAIAIAIQQLADIDQPVDLVTVTDQLRRNQQLDAIGGSNYLASLIASCDTPANATHHAQIVANLATRRLLQTALLEAQQRLDTGNLDDILDRLSAHVHTTRRVLGDNPQAVSSWTLRPLLDQIAADAQAPTPDLLTRRDGISLLYRGKLHDIHGEPEAGKGWVVVHAAAQVLHAGGTIAYIDLEDTAITFAHRLRQVGITDEEFTRCYYTHPHDRLNGAFPELPALYDLIIIDSVNAAMTLQGFSYTDNEEIERWQQGYPQQLANTGAAVLMLDHVTKSSETRGRWAIGGERKLGGVDVSLELVNIEPFTPGRGGRAAIKITKDRHGRLRAAATDPKRKQIAELVMDEAGRLELIEPRDGFDRDTGAFRPTHVMEAVSRYLEGVAFTASSKEIRGSVSGRDSVIGAALSALQREGYISVEAGPRNVKQHGSLKPYREGEDPL